MRKAVILLFLAVATMGVEIKDGTQQQTARIGFLQTHFTDVKGHVTRVAEALDVPTFVFRRTSDIVKDEDNLDFRCNVLENSNKSRVKSPRRVFLCRNIILEESTGNEIMVFLFSPNNIALEAEQKIFNLQMGRNTWSNLFSATNTTEIKKDDDRERAEAILSWLQ